MINFPKNILADLQMHLIKEKEKVEEQMKNLNAQDPFKDAQRSIDNAASDAEAGEENNHDRYEAMVAQLSKKLDDINGALSRIEAGTYGLCTSCQQLIDTDRLALVPTATQCMQCEGEKGK